jgi:hypothetical protein
MQRIRLTYSGALHHAMNRGYAQQILLQVVHDEGKEISDMPFSTISGWRHWKTVLDVC